MSRQNKNRYPCLHRASTRLIVGTVLAIAMGVLPLAGAEPPGHDHGHAHPEPATKAGEQPHSDGTGDRDEHGAHADEVTLTEEAVRRNGIQVAEARARKLTARISATARLAFNGEAMAHVGSLVSGRARVLKARVGDVVRKGDVLAVIDSAALGEAQSDYLQKRSAAENLAPIAELAKTAYERAQAIHDESQGISLTEVQSRQREYRTLQGELAAARMSQISAGNRLMLFGMTEASVKTLVETGTMAPSFEVRAPIDGTVIQREVTQGELVGPEKDALFVLADMRSLWVLADVPEAQSGAVAVGQPVEITVVALPGEVIKGTVAYLSPELDASTRTARVRVEVDNPAGRLRAGMFARAEITAAAPGGEPVVAVPDEAIQTVEGESAVFVPVAGEANTFAKRPVTIGPAVGGMVPIVAGLKAGEPFVATGSFLLKAELGKAGASHEH